MTNDAGTLVIGDEELSVLSADIPLTQITAISYDRSLHSRGLELLEAMSAGPENPATLLLLSPYTWGGILLLTPSKEKMHFITLDFTDEKGQPGELTFRADKKNYEAILAQLTETTGRPWRNLYAERKALCKQLERARLPREQLCTKRPAKN